MVEKVRSRLSGWKSKNLSFGGRIVLLQSVLSAILIYFLSFSKAPAGIVSQLEILFKKFLWGGDGETQKIHWVRWDKICREKSEGGLGIKSVRAFNLALLGKWHWRMSMEKNSLWYKVLVSKDGERGGELWGDGRRGSNWWKDVFSVEEGGG